MMNSKFNILWIDDEWESMTSFQTFCKLHYKMELYPFKTQKEGLEEYAKNRLSWDALILDVKVLDESEDEVATIDSFIKAKSRIETEFKDLPYFVSTGQPDLLSDSMFQTFVPVYYEKGTDDEKLCQDIIEAIDNKPIRLLRNKYPKEFEAAHLIPNAENLLVKGLQSEVIDYTSDNDVIDSFNPIRMLCENIIDKCQQSGYIPYLSSMNSICDFLNLKEVEGFKLNKPIMHKTLIGSLEYFLSITQDGSHDKKNLSLEVIDYVRSRQNDNLYKSILYITMDLLLWYKELIETAGTKDLWSGTYEAQGKACAVMSGSKQVYTVNGLFQIEDNGELKDGDEVCIIKSIPTRFPMGNVTKFVRKSWYIIK